ncbi:hypothetical protein [Streptococcus gallolyticus]|uniref:hypothetical protein n=1 Tax=Streptococcus gallolyticus TaxID=315405 RepID=UPI00077774E3|nr:hypothetical protein [Streptococcus gallolyticus]
MNGYTVNYSNLEELSNVGNSNQGINDIQPQGTVTTIPLSILITAKVCVPVSYIYNSFETGCIK